MAVYGDSGIQPITTGGGSTDPIGGKNGGDKAGVTVREPWAKAAPYLEDFLGYARDQYGKMPTVNTSGLGITTGQQYGQMAGRSALTAGRDLQNEYRGLQGPTAASKYLTDMASNTGVDPYFEQALNAQTDQVSNQLKSMYAGAGRFGSNAFGEDYMRTLGGVRANALSDQWNAARNRQMQATGMLDQANLAQAGARAGILNQLTGVQQGNFSNRLAALNGQTQAQAAQIAGQQAIADLPWSNLRNYAGMLNTTSPYVTDTQWAPKVGPFQKLLGAVGTIGGLVGKFL